MTTRRWRLAAVAAIAAVLAVAGCAGSAATRTAAPAAGTAAQRPNIVFVLTDDLSTDLVKFMPHVKKMQANGVSFKNAFVSDSLCCPSRSTIFTGKYPHDTGVYTNVGSDGGYGAFNRKGNVSQTYATVLQKQGYRTAMMGKYLNGYSYKDAVPKGWNEWDVTGNGYPEYNYVLNENGKLVKHGHKASDYLTDVVSERGSSFISSAASSGKPFMMEVASFAPHQPATPAKRDRGKYTKLKLPRGASFNEKDLSDKPAWLRHHKKLTPKQIRSLTGLYRNRARSVQAVDRMIGNLEKAVQKAGVAKNTYFVFSSDNGFHMGQHRLWAGKQTAFDTDIHVPTVVTGPGVPHGATTSTLAENTDFAPTFEALAGAAIPASVDGQSLVPALHGKAMPAQRKAVLIEHHGPNTILSDPDHQPKSAGNPPSYEAIRTRTELYVEYADGEREYYNLRTDPHELRNTYGKLTVAHKAALRLVLHRLENCHGITCRPL